MTQFFAKTAGKRGEIYVYDAIGRSFFDDGVSAKSFAESLNALGNVSALDLYINSPGGSVFEGLAIYNQIKRFAGEKIVHIDGIAASIASVIAMAGDEVRIAANGTIMIHDPWGMAMGTADEMRKTADSLDKTRDVLLENYIARTGGKREEISAWMSAETWMNADEAVERGFATSKVEEKQFSAAFPMLEKFNKVPERLRKQASSADAKLAAMNMRLQRMNLGASPKTA
jgi:ATP-dependent Clp protease, protease subunit